MSLLSALHRRDRERGHVQHLIHIGFPKTGSNLMRAWFASHQQLHYAAGAIGGFHNVYEMVRQAAAGDTAGRYFATSSESFALPLQDTGLAPDQREKAPPAEATARACHLLADFFPRARILIVTRGYASMMLSSYSQYVRGGGDRDLASLVAAIGTTNPWDYDATIDVYRATFGEDRVIVMPWELLRDNAHAFFAAIADRLGIDVGSVPDHVANPSLSPAALAWYPRLVSNSTRLPLPAPIRRKITGMVRRSAFADRLGRVIPLLQRCWPGPVVGPGSIDGSRFRELIVPPESLRREPAFASYLADYFLDQSDAHAAARS